MSSNAEPAARFFTLSRVLMLTVSAFVAEPFALAAQGNAPAATDLASEADLASEDSQTDEQAEANAAERDFDDGRINILITVPRGEVNQAQAQECEDRADAGSISGEIVVCRQFGISGENYYSGSPEEARKRYAEETAFKGDPRAPNTFGIPDHGNGIGFGSVPPPAIFIDLEALPEAPAGSDADRIARGLPPLGEDPEPTPEEIAKRRRALGLDAPPVPGEPE